MFAGKLDGIYNEKEVGLFKEEGKQSVRSEWLSKAVRKQMGSSVNWEDEWEEEEELIIGEFSRMMVAEEK